MEMMVDSLQREHPFTGEEINKNVIKIANAKLILSEEYKSQYEAYKSLYELEINKSYLRDSIINKQQAELKRITIIANDVITRLNTEQVKSRKYKKQRNIAIGVSGVLATIAFLFIK